MVPFSIIIVGEFCVTIYTMLEADIFGFFNFQPSGLQEHLISNLFI